MKKEKMHSEFDDSTVSRPIFIFGLDFISSFLPSFPPSSMSPTAVYSAYVPPAATPVKGPALAIGSPSTALDGQYQSMVTDLEASRKVDRQMLDRIVDGGSFCMPRFYRALIVQQLPHWWPRRTHRFTSLSHLPTTMLSCRTFLPCYLSYSRH